MEHAIIAIYGALLRRWWGGWLNPSSTMKRAVVAVSALLTAYYSYGLSWAALIAATSTCYAFVMHDHGWGMGMGRAPVSRPLWRCLAVMFAQYGGLAILTWAALSSLGASYVPLGILVPFGYWAAWEVHDRWKYAYGDFINSPTCIGELVFGASFFASMGW